jgi:hypothetical protein
MSAVSEERALVSTEKMEYLPEDVVRGVAKFKAVEMNDLWCLEVLGYEKVEWSETMTFVVQGFVQTYVEKASGNSRILYTTIILTKSVNVVSGSVYEIPFSFTLPANIPGSSPSIHYRVSAFVADADHKPLNSEVSHANLNLVQESPIKKRYQLKSEKAVNFMMCCNRGKIRCKISPEKPWYSPGENATFSCRIHNKSKGDVNAIKVSLSQVKKLVSDEGITKSDEKLILHEELTIFEPAFNLWIPHNLDSSIFGKNYLSYYVLDVHVIVSRGNGPTVRLPIIIVPKRRESSLDDAKGAGSETVPSLPPVKITIPTPYHVSSFSLQSFPHVVPFDELQRSSSRLSQGWSMVKEAIKSGSKIFSTRK